MTDGAADRDSGAARVAETLDEGLSPERTELAWGRTGLAVLVAVGVLGRRVWSLGGAIEIGALAVVGVGGLLWLLGMSQSRDLHTAMAPHGLAGQRAFALVTAGTFMLAMGGLIISLTLRT